MVRPQSYSPKLDGGDDERAAVAGAVGQPCPRLAPLAGHVGEGAPGGDGPGQARATPTTRTTSADGARRREPHREPALARAARRPRSARGQADRERAGGRAGRPCGCCGRRRGGRRAGPGPSGASGEDTGPRCATRQEEDPEAEGQRGGSGAPGAPRSASPASDAPATRAVATTSSGPGGDGIPRRPPLAARGDDERQPVGRAAGDVEEVDLAHDVGGCARSSPGRAATSGPGRRGARATTRSPRRRRPDHHQVTGSATSAARVTSHNPVGTAARIVAVALTPPQHEHREAGERGSPARADPALRREHDAAAGSPAPAAPGSASDDSPPTVESTRGLSV